MDESILDALIDRAIDDTPDSDALIDLIEEDNGPSSPFDIRDAELHVGGKTDGCAEKKNFIA